MSVTSVCYFSIRSRLISSHLISPRGTPTHSHTFENKSSLPPNPLDPLPPPPIPVGGPVLLVHPPNSSSAATLGCATIPPDAPGTIEVLANDPPMLAPLLPQPKSLAGGGLMAAGLLAGAGSGAAQALPPHTSAPESAPALPMEASGLVVVAGAGGDFVCERLKTELGVEDTAGAGAGAGAEAVEVAEKSNRSFMAEDAGTAGLADAAGEEKALKSARPLPDLCGWCDGADGAGLESKKPPPLRPENADADDCCGVDDLLGPENADDCCGVDVDDLLGTGFRLEKAEFCGLFGLDTLEKLRLLNASLKPPMPPRDEPVGCWVICGAAAGDDCMPPKEPEWEWEACGLGAVA